VEAVPEMIPPGMPPELARMFLAPRPPGGQNGTIIQDGNNTIQVMNVDEHFMEEMLGIHMMKARRVTPTTFVGSVLLPALFAFATVALVLKLFFPPKYESLCAWMQAKMNHPTIQSVSKAIAAFRQRFKLTPDRMTTICVSCYFLHEGFSAWQIKWAELSKSLVPVRTPFGYLRMVPHWQKGDAVDLVLLFTAFCTAANILPEIGLVLLFVDVLTDAIDMLAQLSIVYMVEGSFQVSELMAKKLSLLGVMLMVTLHQWRKRNKEATKSKEILLEDDDDSSTLVGSVALLVGRLLMAALFFQCAVNELGRLYLSDENVDIDPNDGHNVVWPKVIELALAIPLVIGWKTRRASCLLAATLLLEAVSCWQFWWIRELGLRLHNREHFAVNTAVAGGLLLLQSTGGGRYTVEELLKKAS